MKAKLTNPLDELFEIEHPSSEVTEYQQISANELATLQAESSSPDIDKEDLEIDQKIDAVHDAAMQTFQNQMQYAEIIEPRYAARNAEVAATYLNIALNAAGMRAKVKADRKRSNSFVPYSTGKTQNNVVVASREDIMRMISIDAETKEGE
jgi:hypothetical protein